MHACADIQTNKQTSWSYDSSLLQSLILCRVGRGRRGVQAGIAEKKISILERALEFHPGSDRLLMALLDSVSLTLGSTYCYFGAISVIAMYCRAVGILLMQPSCLQICCLAMFPVMLSTEKQKNETRLLGIQCREALGAQASPQQVGPHQEQMPLTWYQIFNL